MHKSRCFSTSFFLALFAVFCSSNETNWSPESAEILFMSNRDGNAEIYVAAGIDAEWKNLTNNEASDNWASWSPDGSKILFQSRCSGNLDVWIMNQDGTNPVQLTTHEDHDYVPSFTPDGTEITFSSWRQEASDMARSVHVYLMNADGSDKRRLIAESLHISAGTSWHPEGKTFLVTKKVREKGADIYEYGKSGDMIRQVTDDTLYSGDGHYSPDGSKIAFYQSDDNMAQIVVMDADGTNSRLLLSEGQNYYPKWSPDGKWILYSKIMPDTEGKDIDIFAIQVEGGTEPLLLVRSPLRDAEGIWKPH